jgi:hypothetical protein
MHKCFQFLRITTLLLVLTLTFVHQRIACAQRTASTDVVPFFDEVGIIVDGNFIPGFEATPEQLAGNPVLFENHSEDHLPIYRPDGSTQVTYADFAEIEGTATIAEVDSGTEVTIDLSGLIPNGIYTIWADYFQSPGFTPDFAHELGVGALGYDGDNPPADPDAFVGNRIVADDNGHGQLVAIQPPGPPSWFTTELGETVSFEVSSFMLDPPVFELDLVAAYHQDGNTWGTRPGAGEGFDAFDATWVGQGIGVFVVPEPCSTSLAILGLLFVTTCRKQNRLER